MTDRSRPKHELNPRGGRTSPRARQGRAAAVVAALAAAAGLAACGGTNHSASSGTSHGASPGSSHGTSPAAAAASNGPSQAQIDKVTGPDRPFAPAGDRVLPKRQVVLKSALGVDLSHSSVTLPLHQGEFHGKTVWFVMTEASDMGVARDLGLNFSPKLSNMSIGCPRCVQNVNLSSSPKNKFGDGVIHFQGVPNFAPTRNLKPGPAADPTAAFPPANAAPGAVADAHYSPFIRINGSSTVYNAPIIAVGKGGFDLAHHTNTSDRVLSLHLPTPAAQTPSGQSKPGSVELLLVQGFEAGQKIFYLSTEASDPAAATLERATFVPALQHSPFQGGDDSVGSARERIFIFTNGQTGANNPQAQGLSHLILDGHNNQDASLSNKPLINALANGNGDLLNVLGDFPSLTDPRHADAYSPLWDAQLGAWTKKAVQDKLNVRQTDENQILNLAATKPDLLTGPLGSPYGAGGFVINCPTIAFTQAEPLIDKAAPLPNSQS